MIRCTAFQSSVTTLRHFRRIPDRGEHDRRAAAHDARHLPPHADEQPALLFVVVPDVAFPAVEIELIAAQRELVVGRHRIRYARAPVVDAAVPGRRDAVVQLQLEVLRPAAPPDDERVALDDRRRRDFTDQHPVLDPPVLRVPLPPAQGLAVEDRLEAGLVAGHRRRPIALPGGIRRRRWRLLTCIQSYPDNEHSAKHRGGPTCNSHRALLSFCRESAVLEQRR